MSFISSFRTRRAARRTERSGRSLQRAVAAASSSTFRDELVTAASERAGLPPRL